MASNIARNATEMDYLKPISSQNLTFKTVTELEIDNFINNLYTKNSSGYDYVSTSMLKKDSPN